MAYIDYAYFESLFESELTETGFNRLVWNACRRLDIATTGIDNVKKMKIAFPTDEDDAETVKRCAAELVNTLYQIEQAEDAAQNASGYVTREDGTVVSKLVSSVSAGNESISYSTSSNSDATTRVSSAVSDSAAREQLLNDTITEYLSGIEDANGVNLLYMGRYPVRLG